MLTRLFNHLINILDSGDSRDDRAGLVKTVGPIRYSNLPARVEVYAPRRISRQQVFQFGSRQLYIDHVIYCETAPQNGDFIYWQDRDKTFRVDAIVEFPAQGSLPTYYVIGALEITP